MPKNNVFEHNHFLQLYSEGKTDIEISKILNCSSGTVYKHRKKYNLKAIRSDLDKNKELSKKILELRNQRKSAKEISKLLNISKTTLHYFFVRNNISKLPKKENVAELDFFEKSALLGIILGDGHLSRNYNNTCLVMGHSKKQESYIYHKLEILKKLDFWVKEYKILDKRTGKMYEQIKATSKSNKILRDLYPFLYKEKKKIISKEILDTFNEISLAYLFMDDGSGSIYNLQISLDNFQKEEITMFRIFLLEKWGIETTHLGSNKIRIRQKSTKDFKDLIQKYIIPEMEYKLKYVK